MNGTNFHIGTVWILLCAYKMRGLKKKVVSEGSVWETFIEYQTLKAK